MNQLLVDDMGEHYERLAMQEFVIASIVTMFGKLIVELDTCCWKTQKPYLTMHTSITYHLLSYSFLNFYTRKFNL